MVLQRVRAINANAKHDESIKRYGKSSKNNKIHRKRFNQIQHYNNLPLYNKIIQLRDIVLVNRRKRNHLTDRINQLQTPHLSTHAVKKTGRLSFCTLRKTVRADPIKSGTAEPGILSFPGQV